RDQVAALAGVEKRSVDVGAMSDGVRLLETGRALHAKLDAGDELAGEGVAHLHAGRGMRVGEYRVFEPDPLQHAENVGAELDAGADLAEFRRLLEHTDREAFVRERAGGGETANAAAGDEEGPRAVVCRHLHFLFRG